DIGGRTGQHKIWMSPDGFTYCIDLIQGSLHRNRTGHVARHPDGKEDGVEPTLAHSRDIDVPVFVSRADVEGLLENQPLGRIVMRVYNDRALVKFFGARGDLVGRSGLSKEGCRSRGNDKDDDGAPKMLCHAHHLNACTIRGYYFPGHIARRYGNSMRRVCPLSVPSIQANRASGPVR